MREFVPARVATFLWMLEEVPLAGAPSLVAVDGDPAAAAEHGCVIFFHGLGAGKGMHRDELAMLAAQGYVAIGIDAVGHGERRDPGAIARLAGRDPNAVFLELVAETADEVPDVVDELVRRGWARPDRIGIVGVSMGGFVAYGAVLRERRISAAVAITASPEWGRRPDSPHLRPDDFAPVALLSVTAADDARVPPTAVRALHHALAPRYARSPERLCYLEHPAAGHWMPRAAWERTALEAVGWLDRFVRGGAAATGAGASAGI
jgi:uncharacterized protein